MKKIEYEFLFQEFYEEVDDDQFEIVFVSLDHSEGDLNTYIEEAHGDWYHIPFGSDEIKSVTSENAILAI